MNPDHHLWLNHGAWWCHVTVLVGGMAERRRFSLRTGDVVVARRRRDVLFERIGEHFVILSRPGRVRGV